MARVRIQGVGMYMFRDLGYVRASFLSLYLLPDVGFTYLEPSSAL